VAVVDLAEAAAAEPPGGPLAGLRVLDVSTVFAGPLAPLCRGVLLDVPAAVEVWEPGYEATPADLAVVDLDQERVVTIGRGSSARDHRPFAGVFAAVFAGVAVRGWPVATVVRGGVMVDADRFPGRYLRRGGEEGD
jgi:hypothetical protein